MTFLKISLSFVPVLRVIRTPGGDLSLNLCPFQGGWGPCYFPSFPLICFLSWACLSGTPGVSVWASLPFRTPPPPPPRLPASVKEHDAVALRF